jgi:acyl carrier protein
MTDVNARLDRIARDVFGDDELVLEDSMTATSVPGWDSLAHVTFMYAIEQEFGVRFSEDEFAELTNVGALRQTLHEKVASA